MSPCRWLALTIENKNKLKNVKILLDKLHRKNYLGNYRGNCSKTRLEHKEYMANFELWGKHKGIVTPNTHYLINTFGKLIDAREEAERLQKDSQSIVRPMYIYNPSIDTEYPISNIGNIYCERLFIDE